MSSATTTPPGRPGRLELEAQVASGVEAVVNEQVQRLELGQQPWEPLTTCSADVAPPQPPALRDGDANLGMQGRIDGWQIDAPQVAVCRRWRQIRSATVDVAGWDSEPTPLRLSRRRSTRPERARSLDGDDATCSERPAPCSQSALASPRAGVGDGRLAGGRPGHPPAVGRPLDPRGGAPSPPGADVPGQRQPRGRVVRVSRQ